MDLLVSHDCGRYGRARREILDVLRRLGDDQGEVERSSVDGIALAHTRLDAREVVRGCRNLSSGGYPFEFALKWLPVDYWCVTDLEAIRQLLKDRVRDQIGANEHWGMQVSRHRWDKHHTRDIVMHLAPVIDRRVDLRHPDKLVRVDVLGRRTAVSVLRDGEFFSVRRERHTAPVVTAAPGEAHPGG